MTKKELVKALANFDDNDTVYIAMPIRRGFNLHTFDNVDKKCMGVYLIANT